MSTPLISVLMTVYNREKYLAAAIESVLASTWRDFELIIIDDRSSDRSVQIARHYGALDSRIKVHVNERNLGDYLNRNQAASHAVGKYLKYVDADDLIYPRGLELLVETMERFPEAGYGLCSLEQDKERIFPFQLAPEEAYRRHYFGPSLFHKAPLSSIIKKDAFWAVGGFSGKQHVGDFEMWHLLSASFPVVLMPHGVVWYREHDEQQMQANRTDVTVPFKYLVLGAELLTSESNPLPNAERDLALRQLRRKQARFILRAAKEHGLAKAAELRRMAGMSIGEVVRRAFPGKAG